MNKYFETLELHKILAMLSEECSNAASRSLALELQPASDIDTVREEIKKTADALELSVKYGSPAFTGFSNAAEISDRAASGAILALSELIEIRKMLHQISSLVAWREQGSDETSSIDYLFECLFPNTHLERLLDLSILSEDELADDASPQLSAIRRKISREELKIRESLEGMIKSSSTNKYLQENIVTIRDGRYVIPVKSEFKGAVSGLVHDTSSTGATLFIEPMSVVEANNEIRLLKAQEKEEIHRIITNLSAMCGEFSQQLSSGYNACVLLNLYFAKTDLAAKMHACAPQISADGVIVLKKARHPLIDKEKVVPVDFSIGETYNSLIITGPNTGGKTVILKTVGLLTAMTMCGLLIPVSDGSVVSIFENILVDIGDRQSIEESLSTFSSHIGRVAGIIDKADTNSLVLLDELGSGTDPIEGAALAVAIIEQLKSQGAKLVCTTHYQELKLYAIDSPDTENASCEFDVTTLKPTYRLVFGAPGKSNAFAISRQLGISDNIINNAESMLSSENRRFEKILEELERSRVELSSLRDEIKLEKEKAAKLREDLEREREAFNSQKEKELEIARREANAIVKRVTKQSEILIDELDSLRKEKDKQDFSQRAIDAKHASRSALNSMYLEANPVRQSDDEYKLPRPLTKGDNVLIADMNKKSVVISPPDESGNCFVQAGIMKTKIHVSKLRLMGKEKETGSKTKSQTNKSTGRVTTKGVQSSMTRRPQLELDIRGYASDDGIYALDSFLDSAVMSNAKLVTVIHGKGTGVLKNAVRDHLSRHRQVKSYRPGMYGEGEDGVTIAQLY